MNGVVIGTCCGCGPHHVRALALAVGKTPKAAECSPAIENHFVFGRSETLEKVGNTTGSFIPKGIGVGDE